MGVHHVYILSYNFFPFWILVHIYISDSLAVNRFSGVIRMETGNMQVGVSISGVLVQHGMAMFDGVTVVQWCHKNAPLVQIVPG